MDIQSSMVVLCTKSKKTSYITRVLVTSLNCLLLVFASEPEKCFVYSRKCPPPDLFPNAIPFFFLFIFVKYLSSRSHCLSENCFQNRSRKTNFHFELELASESIREFDFLFFIIFTFLLFVVYLEANVLAPTEHRVCPNLNFTDEIVWN